MSTSLSGKASAGGNLLREECSCAIPSTVPRFQPAGTPVPPPHINGYDTDTNASFVTAQNNSSKSRSSKIRKASSKSSGRTRPRGHTLSEVKTRPTARVISDSATNDETRCTLCQFIATTMSSLLHGPLNERRVTKILFGDHKKYDGPRPPCQTCIKLASLVPYREGNQDGIWNSKCSMTLIYKPERGTIWCEFTLENLGFGHVEFVPFDDQNNGLYQWSAWDPSWIDLGKLRQWITHNCMSWLAGSTSRSRDQM